MSELNKQQQEAVEHRDGPILVIAGAGTGKTRVITERIGHIINAGWAKHDEVLGLTFTDKAAAEMEERLDQLMPLGYEAIPLMTFHSFCDKILRQYGIDIGISPNFKILQGVEQWLFLKENLFNFQLDYYRPLGYPTEFISALLGHFGRLKEELVSPADYLVFADTKQKKATSDEEKLDAHKWRELAEAYQVYQGLMEEKNQLDFADLQYKTIELFRSRPNILRHLQTKYRYLLVDEYQDTNIAQNEIVDLLAAGHKNLMVVGDDDQSIYKFRGAAISNILKFEEKYPDLKKAVLTQNYRSSQMILDFAYASVQHNNPDRLEVRSKVNKSLKNDNPGDDASVTLMHATTADQEVEYVMEEVRKTLERGVPVGEIAILSRKNHLLHPFTEALKKAGLPYEFPSEKGLYEKPEVRELIALLRAIANPADDVSIFRVLRMEEWNIPMPVILTMMQERKTAYQPLWSSVQKNDACKLFADTLSDLINFSKKHTVGEVLYRFTETMKVYERLLAREHLEAEGVILNIAAFFAKLKDFERQTDENSVVDFTEYLDLAEEAGENPPARLETGDRDAVYVSSVHAAKGLEFNTVFVIGMTQRRFPSDNRKDPIEMPDELVHEILGEGDSHMQEERRLFYVACTRAKERLHLTHSDFYNPSSAEKPRASKRSRFLDEVEEKVTVTHVEKTAEGVERFLKPKSDPESSSGLNPKSEPIAKSPITNFSYSQLTTFERCPRQYEYSFILKIPTPPTANLSFGSTLHNTLLEFYRAVQQNKQASLFTEYDDDLSLKKLLRIYEEKWIPYGYEGKAHMETRKERGKEILTKFYDKFKDDIPRVEYLEKSFKLKVGGYTISGRIDRADKLSDGTLEIIDYKTGKSRSQKQVDEDLQLALYALATSQCFNQPASRLTLYFLDEDEVVTTEPDEKTLQKVEAQVKTLGDAINESDFTPTPDRYVCKWCPYNKICDAAEL
ncbi:UvrD-helicase domain-containing protein [Candidatus Peregrinibacteria bacterium]|nr:UvrD-helicase domain-containing protein [Candidatus Peregrinibacteria bacterium]